MPIRVLHDYFSILGGGERLALTLAHGLSAELVTGSRDAASFPPASFAGLSVTNLGVANWPPGLRTWVLARAFERTAKRLPRATTHLYSGVCAPLAARNDDAQRRVFYCHTPPRFMFDQREFFRGSVSLLARPLLDGLNRWLEPRYREAVARMDLVVANSQHVRARIRRFLDVESTVIHPPCDIERFNFRSSGSFYFSNARLDPLKRVDRIVSAFLQLKDEQLVVASSGPQAESLRAQAQGAPNIRIVGRLSDEQMAEYLSDCRALIYVPVDEDFGISPIEAMAAGKPVIAARAGGLLETLIEGETAVFVDPQAPVHSIIDAVQKLTGARALAMRPACESQAKRFSRERFLSEMRAVI